ncbi:MAG: hypothetical protein DRQ55_19390 [Planctomycetota bacterium]|nr:MAG: hypothetical protein DRQ55_19390 [Planctomycetota bacterium]
MKPRAEPPFVRRGGALWCEQVELAELARAREGRAAWVLSHAAITAALSSTDGPRAVALGAVGPPEVLAMLAAAGHWAACVSSHELGLALAAGVEPGRVLASGRVRDDGFLKDALLAGVAVVQTSGDDDAANVRRLADALGVPCPSPQGAPPAAEPELLSAVGGLLAPLLAPPPDVALDVALDAPRPWGSTGAGRVRVLCLQGEGQQDGTLAALSSWREPAPRPARIEGQAARGGWALVPAARAIEAHAPNPAHPEPAWVMLRGELWRELSPRPLPPCDER